MWMWLCLETGTVFLLEAYKVMIHNSLKDKKILITGATSGIGYETAMQLNKEGACLILTGRNKTKLHQMQEEFHPHSFIIEYDLMNLEDIEKIFQTTKEKMGKLDGMVHCAGMAENSIVKANDIEAIKRVMDLNAFSFVELGKYFSMKKYSADGAAIIAISSIASLLNDPGMVQYSASKAALNAIVKTMSKEFMKRKIRVNALLPANVNTEMFTSGVDVIENFMETALERQPLGIIETEQIAYLIEFLLSDNAKYITGELLTVSGGMTY